MQLFKNVSIKNSKPCWDMSPLTGKGGHEGLIIGKELCISSSCESFLNEVKLNKQPFSRYSRIVPMKDSLNKSHKMCKVKIKYFCLIKYF